MYLISELANKVNVSRTTLLYYEKIGLIKGQRQDNGYRRYSESDVQRLQLLQQLHRGGLTLKECHACLNGDLDKQTLESRLAQLEQEITEKTQARDLIAGLLGKHSQKQIHESMVEVAPDAHHQWLLQQGFNEKDALRVKWLSKDMTTHEQYMQDFMKVFETLERWGPGGESETLKALSMVSSGADNILEIGSGKGLTTLALANNTSGKITAIDNEPVAVENLAAKLATENIEDRVSAVCASMTALPFSPDSFDLIWAEGCVYIMGFEAALKSWKPLIQKNGYLVVSDLVWLTNSPKPEFTEFWKSEYPNMVNMHTRIEQAQALGYQVCQHFTISPQSWDNYWRPLEQRVNQLQADMPKSQALADILHEIGVYKQHQGDQFGYEFFILKV
ncbi:MerR family transcriptional regulator [Vibrio astriarenae]|uniref:MerR family transcriptional regulator n=1 Tax=Vibrio astriarenae TaxID=1481923 RepID=A0A7Z2T2V0_9VIBR|nr:MerR family transcriptional regulator [Vibrio astriarenae]QIA63202.1 MerR family transcriptional regulator [Vibrio astriarenae]